MLDPKKARPLAAPGKIVGEFTSGQLVIAICVLLVAALIVFSMGFLAGRYAESSSRSRIAGVLKPGIPSQPAPVSLPPPLRNAAVKSESEAEGVQDSPRPVPPPVAQAPVPGYPASGTVQPMAASGTGPRITEHPAPAKSEISKPEAPVMPTVPEVAVPEPKTPTMPQVPAVPAPAPPESAAAVEPAPSEKAAAPEKPAPAGIGGPSAPAQPEALPATGTPVKHEEAKPIAEAASEKAQTGPSSEKTSLGSSAKPAKGDYAIQVASFSGSNRKSNAEAYKKRLEANSDLKAEVVPAADGKLIRVLIGNYPDRAAAEQACIELKKRAGFVGSFVKRR